MQPRKLGNTLQGSIRPARVSGAAALRRWGRRSVPSPGFALLREVELLAEAIGGMAAIKAVTSVAAKYLRQHDNLGSIAPGRYADFLVVDGDPLRDVRALRKLTTVYRGGVAHDPQQLLTHVPKSEVARSHQQ